MEGLGFRAQGKQGSGFSCIVFCELTFQAALGAAYKLLGG